MTDQKTIEQSLSHVAWGYFFLNVDFNIGPVSVLPRFVGFLLLLSAIETLSGRQRDLALLKPLCVLLSAWNGVDWLLSWFGGDLDGKALFLDLLVTAAGLYFHFQFLTDMAALAETYQAKGRDLARRLQNHRAIYVVAYAAAGLLSSLAAGLYGIWRQYAMKAGTVAALVTMLSVIFILFDLFALRRCAREEKPENAA